MIARRLHPASADNKQIIIVTTNSRSTRPTINWAGLCNVQPPVTRDSAAQEMSRKTNRNIDTVIVTSPPTFIICRSCQYISKLCPACGGYVGCCWSWTRCVVMNGPGGGVMTYGQLPNVWPRCPVTPGQGPASCTPPRTGRGAVN